MTPVTFPEANSALGGGPAEKWGTTHDVLDLAVFKDGKQIISCWRLSWRERFSALLFGRVWMGVFAPGTHAPVWLNAARTVFGPRKERAR